MDLINELGNDLAVAILVEKRHRQKLDSRAAVDLIDRIENALRQISRDGSEPRENGFFNPASFSTSH